MLVSRKQQSIKDGAAIQPKQIAPELKKDVSRLLPNVNVLIKEKFALLRKGVNEILAVINKKDTLQEYVSKHLFEGSETDRMEGNLAFARLSKFGLLCRVRFHDAQISYDQKKGLAAINILAFLTTIQRLESPDLNTIALVFKKTQDTQEYLDAVLKKEKHHDGGKISEIMKNKLMKNFVEQLRELTLLLKTQATLAKVLPYVKNSLTQSSSTLYGPKTKKPKMTSQVPGSAAIIKTVRRS